MRRAKLSLLVQRGVFRFYTSGAVNANQSRLVHPVRAVNKCVSMVECVDTRCVCCLPVSQPIVISKAGPCSIFSECVCVCVTLTIYGDRLTLDHDSVVDGLAVVGATVLIPPSLDPVGIGLRWLRW